MTHEKPMNLGVKGNSICPDNESIINKHVKLSIRGDRLTFTWILTFCFVPRVSVEVTGVKPKKEKDESIQETNHVKEEQSDCN